MSLGGALHDIPKTAAEDTMPAGESEELGNLLKNRKGIYSPSSALNTSIP